MVAANSGDSRFRHLGGSLYPDITANEIAAAYENCNRIIHENIGRPYFQLSGVVEDLLPMVLSGDEWQEFVDNLPPGVFIKSWGDPPPPPEHVPPATRLLLSEIIACCEEMWHARRRLNQELADIYQISALVHPLRFTDLLFLSATKDSEFLHQQELVKKWVNPGHGGPYEELCKRGNGLVSDGWRALKSSKEPSAGEVMIGTATKGGATVRRRHCVRSR